MIKAAILTVSDSCAEGRREDESGQAVEDILAGCGFEVCERRIVADDTGAVVNELRSLCDKATVDVVLTTGGTGLGPRDVTPEATSSVCERMVPGLSEMIRAEGLKKTKNAVLSRGVAGIRNKTLIINLPGSPKGAKESLEVILDVLPHAVDMMLGGGH
jgi:molybdopterin adenylyltransferase